MEIINKQSINRIEKKVYLSQTEDYSSGDTDSKHLNCVLPDSKVVKAI